MPAAARTTSHLVNPVRTATSQKTPTGIHWAVNDNQILINSLNGSPGNKRAPSYTRLATAVAMINTPIARVRSEPSTEYSAVKFDVLRSTEVKC